MLLLHGWDYVIILSEYMYCLSTACAASICAVLPGSTPQGLYTVRTAPGEVPMECRPFHWPLTNVALAGWVQGPGWKAGSVLQYVLSVQTASLTVSARVGNACVRQATAPLPLCCRCKWLRGTAMARVARQSVGAGPAAVAAHCFVRAVFLCGC